MGQFATRGHCGTFGNDVRLPSIGLQVWGQKLEKQYFKKSLKKYFADALSYLLPFENT